MEISRQSANTIIDELAGHVCEIILAVGSSMDEGLSIFYLRSGQVWYRFFIDTGVLFWNTSAPDRADDLREGDIYIPVWHAPGEQDPLVTIRQVKMSDGVLTIELLGSDPLVIEEDKETGVMRIRSQPA